MTKDTGEYGRNIVSIYENYLTKMNFILKHFKCWCCIFAVMVALLLGCFLWLKNDLNETYLKDVREWTHFFERSVDDNDISIESNDEFRVWKNM